MTIQVIVHNTVKKFKIPSRKKFQTWADVVFSTFAKKIKKNISEICIAIVDKKQSQKLNKTYRKKNKPTNVLSFSYHSISGVMSKSLGDIAICAEVVQEEALLQNKKLESHFAHLTIHGILHLLNYDHENLKDAKKMEALEIKFLKKLGFSNPYINPPSRNRERVRVRVR